MLSVIDNVFSVSLRVHTPPIAKNLQVAEIGLLSSAGQQGFIHLSHCGDRQCERPRHKLRPSEKRS